MHSHPPRVLRSPLERVVAVQQVSFVTHSRVSFEGVIPLESTLAYLFLPHYFVSPLETISEMIKGLNSTDYCLCRLSSRYHKGAGLCTLTL